MGPGELVLLLMLCVVPLLAVLLLVFLVRATQQKTRMGINLNPPSNCPACGTRLPPVRVPQNLRQVLWGGWTCTGCQLELDKWGRPVSR